MKNFTSFLFFILAVILFEALESHAMEEEGEGGEGEGGRHKREGEGGEEEETGYGSEHQAEIFTRASNAVDSMRKSLQVIMDAKVVVEKEEEKARRASESAERFAANVRNILKVARNGHSTEWSITEMKKEVRRANEAAELAAEACRRLEESNTSAWKAYRQVTAAKAKAKQAVLQAKALASSVAKKKEREEYEAAGTATDAKKKEEEERSKEKPGPFKRMTSVTDTFLFYWMNLINTRKPTTEVQNLTRKIRSPTSEAEAETVEPIDTNQIEKKINDTLKHTELNWNEVKSTSAMATFYRHAALSLAEVASEALKTAENLLENPITDISMTPFHYYFAQRILPGLGAMLFVW